MFLHECNSELKMAKNLSCVAVLSSANIFTRVRCESRFTSRRTVDLTLNSRVCRSYVLKSGRGHKSQVSLLS